METHKKVATLWLQRIVQAAFSPDFYRQIGIQRFRHPETGNHVLFYSLPQDEQKRIHDQWQSSRATHRTPMTRREMHDLKQHITRERREQDEAEAAAGKADRKEMAKRLKELKSKNLPKRIFDKEKKRLLQEMESRALAREKKRKEESDAA